MCDEENDDVDRRIRLEERKSATDDRRWRASCIGDYDGFGATAEDALLDLILRNEKSMA